MQQVEFFDRCEVRALLNKALDGQFVTVFAYGQTGTIRLLTPFSE